MMDIPSAKDRKRQLKKMSKKKLIKRIIGMQDGFVQMERAKREDEERRRRAPLIVRYAA